MQLSLKIITVSFKDIDPAWVSALVSVIGVPISVIVIWWQLHKGSVDRKYDARTFFEVISVTQLSKKRIILHTNMKKKINKYLQNEDTLKELRFVEFKNVGQNIAQNVLIELSWNSGKEFFYKALLKSDESYIIFPDVLLEGNVLFNKINFYYLSKLGQELCFTYDIKKRMGTTKIIRKCKVPDVSLVKRASSAIDG